MAHVNYFVLIVLSIVSTSAISFAANYEDYRFQRKGLLVEWISNQSLEHYCDEVAKGNLLALQMLLGAADDIASYPLFGGSFFAVEQVHSENGSWGREFFVHAYGDGHYLNELTTIARTKSLQEKVIWLRNNENDDDVLLWFNAINAALQNHVVYLRTSKQARRAEFPLGLSEWKAQSRTPPAVIAHAINDRENEVVADNFDHERKEIPIIDSGNSSDVDTEDSEDDLVIIDDKRAHPVAAENPQSYLQWFGSLFGL